MTKENNIKPYLKRIYPLVKSEKWLFLIGFVTMLLTTASRLADPLVIAHIIDVSVPKNDVKDMFLWGGLFALIIVFSGFLSYVQITVLAKSGIKVITRIKYEVFNHLTKQPVSWFDKTPTGELISRVESDGERVKELFSTFSIMIIGNILFFVGMLIILFQKDWKITMVLLIPMILIVISAVFIVRYLSKFYKKSRVLNADVTSILTEYMQGMNVVQLFNQQSRISGILNQKSKEKQVVDTKASFIEYGLWGVYDFFLETAFITAIILLTVPKIIHNLTTIGTLIVFIQYSVRLFWPLMQITENINQFQRAFVSLKRMFNLLDLETEKDCIDAEKTVVFQNEIEFKDVWFSYKDEEWVLKGVSFKIKKGQKIALVGASGSGKSTTVSLLCLFYKINKGQILIDGKDIYSLGIKEWREKIGLVLQDIYLFPGNIKENVRVYNDDIDDDTVLESLKLVHADDILERINNDLNFEIQERGQNLSMGERQLISFARAVSFAPEMIIMDEATASIDAKTESKIHKSMELMLQDKTAVIVAHRLSSVLNSDLILLFEEGEIIAQGNHSELLISSPDYRKLVELQFLKHN